ncbi:MAG TPA: amidase [Acetobacteraceae bacterium]|nr:amidase [Acetobacteraceae bacterium]
MPDPADLTATEAARRLRDGRLSAPALAEACLGRLAAREPVLRAMAFLDADAVRRAAAVAPTGPLHGLPLGVKDVLDTADMPSEYNSPIWRGHRPRADAAAVAAARRAGAVVIGKTVTTEVAVRTPGPTTNPINPAHTPGGSSSGSAAGVAAFCFPFAFGTQTAGSIIRPAAFCGAVGFKPSFGTIHRAGMKIMAESLDTIGALARSVADCALLVGAVAGRDLGDPDRHPGRAPRIGLCRSPSWSAASAETRALLERSAEVLRRAGAVVDERELPPILDPLVAAHPVVQGAESAQALAWERTAHPEAISPALRALLDAGGAHTAEALDRARAAFRTAQAAFGPAIADLDILLTPSAPGEAPADLGWTGDPAFNYLWTGLHVPCVTVPVGTGPSGLPLGIQIVGARGEDRATLAWAQWVAAALG